MAVVEIMPFSEEVDDLVIEDAPLGQIKKAAEKAGFIPMIGDASTKVIAGVTSLSAAMKVVDFTARL
jgi:type II secretory ATPase GspE/PulE/Tfp pilus assembly ATPase PilB-like protein